MANVSIPTILAALTKYLPEYLGQKEDLSFRSVQLYVHGQTNLSRESLYVCPCSEFDSEALNSDCCFLCICESPQKFRSLYQGKRIIAVPNTILTVASACNMIQELFDALYMAC